MKRKDTISPSQIRSMDCRLAWHWGYSEGLKPKRSSQALELGSGLHFALEAYYARQEDPVRVFQTWADKRIKDINSQWDDEIKELNDMKTLGAGMLSGYMDTYHGKDPFTVIATEKTISRPLPNPNGKGFAKCLMTVRLDGLVRCHETGKLFSLEHKSFSRFSLGDIEIDPQFTAQIWVGRSLVDELDLGEEIVGTLWNGMRKQLPGPKVKLALFERHRIYRNEAQINSFLLAAYHMWKDSKKWVIFPQPSARKCSGCDYKEPCTAFQRGDDYMFLLQNSFTKRGEPQRTTLLTEESSSDIS